MFPRKVSDPRCHPLTGAGGPSPFAGEGSFPFHYFFPFFPTLPSKFSVLRDSQVHPGPSCLNFGWEIVAGRLCSDSQGNGICYMFSFESLANFDNFIYTPSV